MIALLERLAALVQARPGRVIVLAIVACLALGSMALTVPVDLSFASVMGTSDDPVTARYEALQERMGVASRLLLLLEGDDEVLTDAAQAVAAALGEIPETVGSVQLDVDTEWLEDQAVWVVSDDLFEQWLGAALHPDEPARMDALKAGLEELRDQPHPMIRPGARLIPIQLTSDPIDVELEEVISGRSPYAVTERVTLEALAGFDVQASFSGMGALAAQDQSKTLTTISALSPLSLLVVLALLLFVERRPTRLVLVAVPMLLAMAGTLGVVALVFDQLTFNEAFFGMFIFGLGVDYALHLIVRLREERAGGRTFEEALRETIVGAGRGIAAGSITTVGAFSALILVDDPMPKHMGLAGAVGLTLCMVLMLSLLTAAWVLLEPRAKAQRPHTVLAVPGVGRLAAWSVRHPKLCVALSLAAMALALAGTPRFHPETDLARVFNRDVPAVQTTDRIEELFDLHFTPWVVITDTIAEAQAVHRRFEAAPEFERVEGIGSLFPGDLAARHARLQASAKELRAARDGWAARIPPGLSGSPIFAAANAMLEGQQALIDAGEAGPPDVASIPPAIRDSFLLPDGGFATFAYALGASLNAERFQADRQAAEAVHPGATGLGSLFERVMLGPARWGAQTFLSILVFVLLILAIDLRNPRWVLVAVAPVALGGLVAFGALCWMDVGFTVLLVTVVPLLIGLGVDDGIHVVHRMLEDPELAPDLAAESVGRAIVMTTCTTCATFTVLLFSNHPGMESMSLTMLIGLPLCLLGSVTLTPALAVLLGLRGVEG